MDLTTTGSGLKYTVLQQGAGEKPSSTAPVVTRYTGWLSEGCVIDSSYLRNPNTTTFGLDQPLIRGWVEALREMQVGEKRMLVIPPDLGYGPIGQAPRVPPNSTLIYYVELVDILDPAEATATVETRITSTAQAQGTARANAEATATAFSGGVPATATPTLAPTP
jgi:FKBP-type peptidyl-prolyl cis-trans isomerase FklB